MCRSGTTSLWAWLQNKRTVVFCASVWHAEEIAELFRQAGVSAAAVFGSMKRSEREEFQDRFIRRELQALCVCDLLNEGWDCPGIETLLALAEEVGVPFQAFWEALEDGRYAFLEREAVRHAKEDLEVRVVPALFFGDCRFRGAYEITS